MEVVRVTPWTSNDAPDRERILRLMADEGLSPYTWSNAPHDVYSAHSHSYDKVIYVVQGSISFGLPGEQRQVNLEAGDRLDLAAGTLHDATVGLDGVTCLEAHK